MSAAEVAVIVALHIEPNRIASPARLLQGHIQLPTAVVRTSPVHLDMIPEGITPRTQEVFELDRS
eukprot:CAMPEP_0115595612 /NCGR_PEP_ID=MMETSP0272-20121206/12408_1 /TAXON_ID=71861 /ORGANISM="Scrippsiella trochoidea, Strain CCMP3099" /LENGTH=64 /DNA_ID=CAMNT_0003030921 /DNA_START=199 /DNA_END=393 /DNA_ORIENTATION=+